MMKILMKLLLVIQLSFIYAFASQFTIMTEDLKPYNYMHEGKLIGMNTEIVETILHNLGYEEEITLYPWARALHLLEIKDDGVLFSMSYSQQRAQKYKFACPLAPVEVYFFTHKNNMKQLNNFTDLKDLRIGVVKDFGAHQKLNELEFENLDFSSSTFVMAQKLLENKIDTFAASPTSIYSLDTSNIDLSLVKQSQLLLYKTELCIAFNPQIADEEVQKWEEELKKFYDSPQYQKLYQDYIIGGGV